MITQEYINGYVSALNTLETLYTNQLQKVEEELKNDSSSISLLTTQYLLKSHIQSIENIKNNYKILIKNLNKSNKL